MHPHSDRTDTMNRIPHSTRQLRGAAGRERGFTLLEIMVVVTIIALLATLVAPKLLGQVGARRSSCTSSTTSTCPPPTRASTR